MARMDFNAEEVAPDRGAGPIPEDRYRMMAIEESYEANSKGTGDVLSLTFEIVEGAFKGRQIWVTMNVKNDSPTAQKIGQGQLSALCHATGQMQVEDSEELLWKEFWAETVNKEEEYKGKTRLRTNIKKYLFDEDLAPPSGKASPERAERPAAESRRPDRAAEGRRPPERSSEGGGRRPPFGRGAPQSAPVDDDIPF